MSPSSKWAAMNSPQPDRSQRSSSSAISVSPASIIIWTSSRSSARSRAQRGWTKTQLLPSVERRTLMPSDEADGQRELGLRFDTPYNLEDFDHEGHKEHEGLKKKMQNAKCSMQNREQTP